MANGKSSFVLYTENKELFDSLSNEQAGILIKHIFSYVNDENPELEDPLLKIAFLPIKQNLKRDLKKWETIREKRSDAGKASAEKRKQNQHVLTCVKSVEQTPTNPTVNVNVNDNVNVNVINKDIIELNEGQIKLRNQLCKVFGVSEMNQPQNYFLIENMIRLQITNKTYDWFSAQIFYYFTYKNMTGEKKHGLRSLLGDLIEPDKGAWNSENWKKKCEEEKAKDKIDKPITTQPPRTKRLGTSSTLADIKRLSNNA